MPLEASSQRERILGDEHVPSWAAGPAVAEALDLALAGDAVLVQRRRDGVVIVAVLPLDALAPRLQELLRRHVDPATGGASHRWLLALDADGTTHLVDALGVSGPRASA